MREDFSKVLVERPRSGMRGERQPVERITRWTIQHDPDRIPSFESSSRHRGGTKYLNEHLGPLVRFLRDSVGKPWNDVHAELSEHVRRDNPVQAHVFQHLYDYVEVETQVRDGELLDLMGRLLDGMRRRPKFFVCPETHVLVALPCGRKRRRHGRGPSAPQRAIDADTVYRAIGGIWYRVTLAAWARDTAIFDVGLARVVNDTSHQRALLAQEYGRADVYASRRRQIGSREIRREGLDAERVKFESSTRD